MAGPGKRDDSPFSDVDDWDAAIDQWDAGLDLTVDDVPKPPAAAGAIDGAAAAAPPGQDGGPVQAPAPSEVAGLGPGLAPTPPGFRARAPGDPPSLGELPGVPVEAEDPLMGLFDGEMDLPVEGGEALGGLLGVAGAAPFVPAKVPDHQEEALDDLQSAENEFAVSESTRVADLAELAPLLDDLDDLEDPEDPFSGKTPITAVGQVNALLEDEARIAAEAAAAAIAGDGPDPAAETDLSPSVAPNEPLAGSPVVAELVAEVVPAEDPFAGDPFAEDPFAEDPLADPALADESAADRVLAADPFVDEASRDQVAADGPYGEDPFAEAPPASESLPPGVLTKDGPTQVAPAPLEDRTQASEPIALDRPVQLGRIAIPIEESAAADDPEDSPFDDEFYDAISIVADRGDDSRSGARPQPVEAAGDAVDAVPILEAPVELSVAAAPVSAELDEEVSPAPIGAPEGTSSLEVEPRPDPAQIDAADFDSAATSRYPSLASRPVPAERIVAALGEVPGAPLPEQITAASIDEAALREQLAGFDTERLLAQDDARSSQLAYAAGRVAERLGDRAGATERYEGCLQQDPHHAGALRALRRLRLAEGDVSGALSLLERELAGAEGEERSALLTLRGELNLAMGQHEAAGAAFRQILDERPADLGATLALCDLAAGEEDEFGLAEALGSLAALLEPGSTAALRSALAVERGRVDEAAGRFGDAVERFREAVALDATEAGAAWGLLRVGLRTAGQVDDRRAHAALAKLLPEGPLRGAIERRRGRLAARGGDPVAARAAYQAAAQVDDPVALRSLARLERQEGRVDEAITALERATALERDPGRRAEWLLLIGDMQETLGNTAAANEAYRRATVEAPEDPRPVRGLEQMQEAGGDKQSALARHLEGAERDDALAPVESVTAARLLRELGRVDEALGLLGRALERWPGQLAALELAVELEVQEGRPERAAELLGRAAEGLEPVVGQVLRERAVRLLYRHERLTEALVALAPLAGEVEALGWVESQILGRTDPGALAAWLEREAQTMELVDRAQAAACWHARGLLLRNSDAPLAVEAQRRAIALEPSGAATLALEIALGRASAPVSEAAPAFEARLQELATQDEARGEAVVLMLRLGALQQEGGDPGAARATYQQALERLPGLDVTRQALDGVARRLGGEALEEVLAAEASAEATPEGQAAVRVLLGELDEGAGRVDRAAERYQQALALVPGLEPAETGLERVWWSMGNAAGLADRALGALKEAVEPGAKVAAYERLAHIDRQLRGDQESARLAYASVLEVDPTHPTALRMSEQQQLREGAWNQLADTYSAWAKTVEPRLGAVLYLASARLRGRAAEGAAHEMAMLQDCRSALSLDEGAALAQRVCYGAARAANESETVARLGRQLAEGCEDARPAAVFLTRAGEALVALGQTDEAQEVLERAATRGAEHLPALMTLHHLALTREDWPLAVSTAERLGQRFHQPRVRARSYLLAGALAEEKLEDRSRALADLRQVLALDPHDTEAFERLRRLLGGHEDALSLAALYQHRLEVETDGARLLQLHLDLAVLARDQLKDRDRARLELRAVLALDPAHLEALRALTELHWEDGEWAEAAQVLIRRARLEKSGEASRAIFLRLGVIYAKHLPDPKRAIASFSRVLQLAPEDLTAIEHLSDLYVQEGDWQRALQATTRLAELEPDLGRRVKHLHRVAKVYEEGFKDPRRAVDVLRQAVDLDPLHLPAIGELASFFDRQSDVQSMRVHLDRAAARFRALLSEGARDPLPYRALFRIFGWRRAPERAASAASVLVHLGMADAEESAFLGQLARQDSYPGAALAEPAVDELLFDPRVPAGFRHLFRLLAEPLGKLYRADVKRLGVSKHERLPRSGHAVGDLVRRVADDLGIGDLEVYLSTAQPSALILELSDPLSLVIGGALVEGAHEQELRFMLGRMLKMAHCHLQVPMRVSAAELAVMVAAIVRQFVPDFAPAGVDPAALSVEAQRIGKVIPRRAHGELSPFALELASNTIDLMQLGPALVQTANRAGLLACGGVGPSLRALERFGDESQVTALCRFALSEEYGELRRLLGTSRG